MLQLLIAPEATEVEGLMSFTITNRLASYGAAAALAAALWILPSVGTRGQGTLGDRFIHADRNTLAAPGDIEPDAETRNALARADALVSRAVAGL